MFAFGRNGLSQGTNPYFVYLADGFLHGQLAATPMPSGTTDLILFQDRYFLYWPPFPALLFLPLVAAFGVGVSDAVVSLVVGGIDVALLSWLLSALHDQGLADLPLDKRAWLAAFFAFGTVQVTVAPHPHAAYFTQLVGFGFLCGAYLAALRLPGRWATFAAGILMGCAVLSRSTLLLPGIWIAWYLLRRQAAAGRRRLLATAAAGLTPVGVAVMALGLYNYLRFGSPLDTGLAYLQWNSFLQADVHRYGAFSLHYLPANLFYTFVFFPYLSLLGGNVGIEFWMGGSLFLMSPVFLLAPLGAARAWRSHGWALMGAWLAGLLPMLLWVSTGWVQFGPRLTLDASVPLLMLAAIGASSVSTKLLARLSVISFAVYLPGTIIMGVSMW